MQIINHATGRFDVVGSINAHWMKKYRQNGGALDELRLRLAMELCVDGITFGFKLGE